MIFVDTGAWFARYVADDVDHEAAKAWFSHVPDRLVTTDYVLDELFTLLKVRDYANIAFAVGELLWSGAICQLVHVTEADLIEALSIFKSYQDKDWSFTDCVSRVVMTRLKIDVACAFDDHFRQFGTVTVVP
jgi:uncharacterized protein